MTKLSIPHEFVQRNVLPNKTTKTESLKRVESTSSLDSAPHLGVGKFHSFEIFISIHLIRYN